MQELDNFQFYYLKNIINDMIIEKIKQDNTKSNIEVKINYNEVKKGCKEYEIFMPKKIEEEELYKDDLEVGIDFKNFRQQVKLLLFHINRLGQDTILFNLRYNTNNINLTKAINNINLKRYRIFCENNIELSRLYRIPKFLKKSKDCCVFIEFRNLPHTEFILRKTFSHLNSQWSAKVICGEENYNQMVDLCKEINVNIQVNKIQYDHIDKPSGALNSVDVLNLIDAEKCFIFFENSLLLNDGIEKYLKYDYISEPTNLNIGNNIPNEINDICILNVRNRINRLTDITQSESMNLPSIYESIQFVKCGENSIGISKFWESNILSWKSILINNILKNSYSILYNQMKAKKLSIDQYSMNIYLHKLKEEKKYLDGINIIYMYKEDNNGLGRLTKTLIQMLEEANFCIQKIYCSNWKIDLYKYKPIYDKTLILFNEDTMREINKDILNTDFKYTFKIGFWCWEMEIFNPILPHILDEVWTLSKFTKEAINKSMYIPVKHIRIPSLYLDQPIPSVSSDIIGRYGIPKDKFKIYTICDFKSCLDRKNPISTIKVFNKFHSLNPNSILIIKISNKNYYMKEYLHLKSYLNQNIYFIEDELSSNDMHNLLLQVDCIITLFRSEGLGYTVLDGLSLGKPVIYTKYSSGKEFYDLGFPVGYEKIKPSSLAFNVYQNCGEWADPNLEEAFNHLEYIYSELNTSRVISLVDYKDKTIEKLFGYRSLGVCVEKLKKSLITKSDKKVLIKFQVSSHQNMIYLNYFLLVNSRYEYDIYIETNLIKNSLDPLVIKLDNIKILDCMPELNQYDYLIQNSDTVKNFKYLFNLRLDEIRLYNVETLILENEQNIFITKSKLSIKDIYDDNLFKNYIRIKKVDRELINFDLKYINYLVKLFNVKLWCIYFPQFHQIPENDKFWGEGYTEWTTLNKVKNKNLDLTIKYPHSSIGEYDILDYNVRLNQEKLCKTYGVEGFLYYYYWFDYPVMHKGIEKIIEETTPDLPFVLCWANETWTRRWDGQNNDILLQQTYDFSNEKIVKYLEFIMPFFEHKNYLKENNYIMLYIYRIDEVPKEKLILFVDVLNKELKGKGFNGIKLLPVQNSFYINNLSNLHTGCYLEPLNELKYSWISEPKETIHEKSSYFFLNNEIYYKKIINKTNLINSRVWKGIYYCWNNVPRRQGLMGLVFGFHKNLDQSFTYKLFENFICHQIINSIAENPNISQINLLYNAWNEWGEQAMLEPNNKDNYNLLEIIQSIFKN